MPVPNISGILLLGKKKVFNYVDSRHTDLSHENPKALSPLDEHVSTSHFSFSGTIRSSSSSTTLSTSFLSTTSPPKALLVLKFMHPKDSSFESASLIFKIRDLDC